MSTPETWKAQSEARLRALGFPVNVHLPLIEPIGEVELRSNQELLQRMVALWAVAGSACLKDHSFFARYISSKGLETWLSQKEREFLFNASPTPRDEIQFTWRTEALYFLAWCAGLIDRIDVPSTQSSLGEVFNLFPQENEDPTRLSSSIQLRSKAEILAWSDMLYRLHWAVRNSMLKGSPDLPNLQAGAVQEWHQAVNWVTKYQGEENWDHVGTDT